MPRTAEVIYVGDAASLIRASREAEAATAASADGIANANKRIATSYGEVLVAQKEAVTAAQRNAVLLGGSMEEQQAAATRASAGIEVANTKIATSAKVAGEAAAKNAAVIGGSLEEQGAAFVSAARSAAAYAQEQETASAVVAAAAGRMDAAMVQFRASATAAASAAARAARAEGATVERQAAVAGEAARAQAAAVGASSEEQVAAYAKAADAAKASAIVQASSNAKSGVSLAQFASHAKSIGGTMSTYVTVPVLAAAAAGVKLGMSYETEMLKIHTQAGASTAELHNMSKAVIDLAPHTQQGPVKLAEALYQLESVGARGSRAMASLRAASEGAAMGNADLESTTSALAAVTTAYDLPAKNMQYVMGTLDATVGVGKMRMEELVESFHTGILPVAAMAHVSIRSLGADLAVLTDRGVPATRGMTYLRQAIFYLANESTEKAKNALKALGLTSSQVASELAKPDGLAHVVELLHEKMKKLGSGERLEILKDLGGGARSATGLVAVYNSLGNSISDVRNKYEKIGEVAKSFHQRVAEQARTMSAQMHQAWSSIQTSLIQFGDMLGPILVAVAGFVAKIASDFAGLSKPVKTVITVIALLGAVGGPVLLALGAMSGAINAIMALLTALGVRAAVSATEVGGAAAGMATAVEGADASIEAANVAAGASFTAMLGPIGAVAVAVAALGLPGVIKATQEGVPSGDSSSVLTEGFAKGGKYNLNTGGGIMAFFESKGLSPAAAAGIAGNVAQESSFNPNAPGGGLFQDIGGRGAGPGASITKQLEKAWEELLGPYASVLGELKKAKSPEEAARIFSGSAASGKGFERPGTPETAKREQYAREAYKIHPGESWRHASHPAHHPATHHLSKALEEAVKNGEELPGGAVEPNTGYLESYSKAAKEAAKAAKHRNKKPPKLFTPHAGAYGFFEGAGTNYTHGSEEEIAARLDALGKALKTSLTGISGYRTPAHSVAVGGFANDPHTRGEASDTQGAQNVAESVLRRFGLTRPFPGAKEADHIQLLPGAPRLKGAAGSPELGTASHLLEQLVKAEEKRRTEILAAITKDGQSALSKINSAVTSGNLKDLTKVIDGTHTRALATIERNLSLAHKASLTKLAGELVKAHKESLTAWAKAMVEQAEKWTDTIKEIGASVKQLVEQAGSAMAAIAKKAIEGKHTKALEGLENGPDALALRKEKEEGEAESDKATEEGNAKTLADAKKKLHEATGNENPEEIREAKENVKRAEEAITQFARAQDEKRREKKTEEERKGIDAGAKQEETALEESTKRYEETLDRQLAVLMRSLGKGEIDYKNYVESVNRILAGSGVELKGNKTDEGALAGGQGSTNPGGVVSSEGTGGTKEGWVRIGPGHASGGNVYPGISYMVGETGPEPFTPDRPGTIGRASQSSQSAAVMAPQVNFHGPVNMLGRGEASRFAHRLAHKLVHGGHI